MRTSISLAATLALVLAAGCSGDQKKDEGRGGRAGDVSFPGGEGSGGDSGTGADSGGDSGTGADSGGGSGSSSGSGSGSGGRSGQPGQSGKPGKPGQAGQPGKPAKPAGPQFEILPFGDQDRGPSLDYRRFEKGSKPAIMLQQGHTRQVVDVQFTPDGRYLVTASDDRKVKVWNAASGVLVKTMVVPAQNLRFVAVSPSGREIAVGCRGKKLFRFSIGGKLLDEQSGADYDIDRYAISPDGKTVVTSDGYRKVTLRDRAWKPRKTFDATDSKINCLAFTRDGKAFLVGGSQSKTAQGWRSSVRMYSTAGTLIREIELKKPAGIVKKAKGRKRQDDTIREAVWVDLSPDGKRVAVLGEKGRLHLRTLDGKLISSVAKHFFSPHECRFTPDGKSVVVVEGRQILKVGIDGRPEGRFRTAPRTGGYIVYGFDMAPDGQRLATGYRWEKKGQEGRVKIWNRRGRLQHELRLPARVARGVAISPDHGQVVLEFERGKDSLLWNVRENSFQNIPGSVGWYADGTRYRFSLIDKGRTLKLADRNGERELGLQNSYPIPLADGSMAYIPRARGSVTVYDPEGTPLKTIEYNKHGRGLADETVFSPDGSYFALETATSHGGFFAIELHSMEDGKEIRDIEVLKALSALAIGPKGQQIAVGHEDGDITIWSKTGGKGRKGKLLQTLKGHTVEVEGLAFSADGKFLVSSSGDRTVRLWNLKTGTHLTLLVLESGDWLAYDHLGRFDTSDGGRRHVKFVQGMTVYNFQQFWDELFTPGLLDKALGGKAIKGPDLAIRVVRTPVVTLEYRGKRVIEGGDGAVGVNVCATARKGGVGDVFLFHNGRALDASARGLVLGKRRGKCQAFTLTLTPGENSLTGAAYDKKHIAYGQSEAIAIEYRPAAVVRPELYLLTVGVSEYRDRNIRLKYPASDARAIAGALRKVGSSLYGAVHVEVLLDGDATQKAVRQALESILGKARNVDTVVVYLAGHGDTDKGAYYFLGHDADITDLKGSAISVGDISDFARQVAASKIAVFLDTCKSGSATRDLTGVALARGFEERKIIAGLAKERGIAVFSAASKDQAAFEIIALKHGIFTYSMLDYLNNRPAEVANHGLISVAKLLSLVNRRTRELADEYLKMEQTPILYMFGDDFSLGYAE